MQYNKQVYKINIQEKLSDKLCRVLDLAQIEPRLPTTTSSVIFPDDPGVSPNTIKIIDNAPLVYLNNTINKMQG